MHRSADGPRRNPLPRASPDRLVRALFFRECRRSGASPMKRMILYLEDLLFALLVAVTMFGPPALALLIPLE